MFFRIIKNDLKRTKTLSITIFLFIFMSSIIAAVSAAVYFNIERGMDYTFDVTNIGDYIILQNNSCAEQTDIDSQVEKWAFNNEKVTDFSFEHWVSIMYKNIIFEGRDEYPIEFKYYNNYLTVYPKKNNYVYDIYDKPFSVKHGEIAIPITIQKLFNVQIGDNIQIKTLMGNVYEFKVSTVFKDSLYPIGCYDARYILSENDYNKLQYENKIEESIYSFSLDCSEDEYATFISEYGSQEFVGDRYWNYKDSESFEKAYEMPKLILCVLIFTSIFLFIVVILTIRFIIASSVQEDYKEIGMIKAVGIPSFDVKSIYIAKYLFLSVFSGGLGFLVSIPCSIMLVYIYSDIIIIFRDNLSIVISLLAVIFIIILIVIFCYLNMFKIDKMSAVKTINYARNDKQPMKLYLFKKKKMSITLFHALNNILNGFRRYIFLIIAYILGVIVLLMPINIINTVRSSSYLKYMEMLPADVYLYDDSGIHEKYTDGLKAGKSFDLKEYLNWIDTQLEEKNINTNFKLSKESYYNYKYKNIEIPVSCTFGDINNNDFEYSSGTAPIHDNQLAVSAFMAKRYNIQIGDTIILNLKSLNTDRSQIIDEEKEFIVTAEFETMENEGMRIRMGNEYDNDYMDGYMYHGICFIDDKTKEEKTAVIKKLQNIYGENSFLDVDEYMEKGLSSYGIVFNSAVILITAIVVIILFMMTLLYTNLIISKEIPEIAMLKTLGFSDNSIIRTFMARIVLLMILSIIIGASISKTVSSTVAGIIFSIYNLTSFDVKVNYVYTLITAPAILTAIVIIGVYIGCRKIRGVNIQKISND